MIRITMILIAILCTRLNSQTKTFNSVGNWHNAMNWTPNGVPQVQDSVVIFGTAIIEADSTAYARHVRVEENWLLQIDRDLLTNKPGRLNLMPFNMTEEVGLEIDGTLIQGGRLDIEGYQSESILNNGIFESQDRSKTIVDSYITNEGKMIIDGLIEIEATDKTYGLQHMGDSVLIEAEGMLLIKDSYLGITTEVGSYFESLGYIEICDIMIDGIENEGVFLNYDTIQFNSCQVGLENKGGFTNGGVMNFDGDYNRGITNQANITNTSISKMIYNGNSKSNSDAITNEGVFGNFGLIEIDSFDLSGIRSFGEFNNNGEISIRNVNIEAIHLGQGTFTNAGEIDITLSNVGINIENSGTFDNHAMIYIDSVKSLAINNQDTLKNDGVIKIQDLVAHNAQGLKNALSTSYVRNNGLIELYNIDSSAIHNLGLFVNNDSLLIHRIYDPGIITIDSFINGDSAQIIITSINGGAYAIANVIGLLQNFGVINIDNCEGPAIINLGTLSNLDTIKITNVISEGLTNIDSFYNGEQAYLFIEDVSEEMGMDEGEVGHQSKYFKSNEMTGYDGIGIRNEPLLNRAIWINEGMAQIELASYGLVNCGEIINHDTIISNDMRSHGLINAVTPELVKIVSIYNHGYIYVDGDHGLSSIDGTHIEISETGKMVIDSDEDDAMNIWSGGTLDCFGELEILNTMNPTGTGE